jgi:hypothetical protein
MFGCVRAFCYDFVLLCLQRMIDCYVDILVVGDNARRRNDGAIVGRAFSCCLDEATADSKL